MSPDRTGYVTHSDCSRHDTGWRHPEHQGRLPAIARAVHRDMLTLFDHLLEVEGVPAEVSDLLLAHEAEYVQRVERRCAEAAAAGEVLPLEGEVRVSGASWDAVRAGVGCVLTALERVRAGEARNAFCAVRPPGSAAGRAIAGGFSIFNGVAIGALTVTRTHGERVLVVEWGSRPGTGTMEILRGEAAARIVSVSASGVPTGGDGVVQRRAEGAAVAPALREALDESLDGFAPEWILLSLGCDGLASDPLGGMGLEPRDYYDLTEEVRMRAEAECGGRLVSVLEGGYDAEGSARAVVQHLRALTGLGAVAS